MFGFAGADLTPQSVKGPQFSADGRVSGGQIGALVPSVGSGERFEVFAHTLTAGLQVGINYPAGTVPRTIAYDELDCSRPASGNPKRERTSIGVLSSLL